MDSNPVTLSLADLDLSTPTPLQHQANATQADTTQLEVFEITTKNTKRHVQ